MFFDFLHDINKCALNCQIHEKSNAIIYIA